MQSNAKKALEKLFKDLITLPPPEWCKSTRNDRSYKKSPPPPFTNRTTLGGKKIGHSHPATFHITIVLSPIKKDRKVSDFRPLNTIRDEHGRKEKKRATKRLSIYKRRKILYQKRWYILRNCRHRGKNTLLKSTWEIYKTHNRKRKKKRLPQSQRRRRQNAL